MPGTTAADPEMFKIYRARPRTLPLAIDADWDKPAWREAETGQVALFMGERPEHQPPTRFRVLYDEQSIYIIFQVRDRYVRAVSTRDEGRVWEDSCVEFFFTPGPDVQAGYFNFETNCIGKRLWHFHPVAGGDNIALDPADLACAEVATTLHDAIAEEKVGPVTWTVEYRFPVEILNKYTQVVPPAPGARWRANFYKCADLSSHPHFLTWSRVARPKPQFHVPECFGTIEFTG